MISNNLENDLLLVVDKLSEKNKEYILAIGQALLFAQRVEEEGNKNEG